MRYLPSALREKLLLAVQAESTKAAPSVDLWISRPTIPLTGPDFLESQLLGTGSSISSVSIAECHPRTNRDATYSYIAYIDDSTVHVVRAAMKEEMADHVWLDTGFSVAAVDVSIAFDGTMPKATTGKVEFVTESQPWIFWIDAAGVLYGQKLDDTVPTILALQNATCVTAVRAMWSEVGGFDFGLIVFFILAGDIYYRQYIDSAWTDAELVQFGPDVTYVKIAASRTWDYRVCLQAQASDGMLYELFTQYAGIGKQNVEHLELTKITAGAELIRVTYHDTSDTEHIELAGVSPTGVLTYGLTSLPVSVTNMDDGTGNWGIYIQVAFDHPLFNGVVESYSSFVLTDGNGVTYTATVAALSENGLVVTLTMSDFNLAALSPECTLFYSSETGTIQCAVAMLASFNVGFIATNLVPPVIDPPEVEAIWNE